MNEIERKFLVKNTDFLKEYSSKYIIKQGYLSLDSERIVRVRLKGEKAFLTIKGKTDQSGTTRFEWEKEISVPEAEELLKLCLKIIEKTRYIINFEGFTFEVDVFENKHSGLILAEIELQHKNQLFKKPSWLGEEVTGKQEYYNSNL